jgi:hypothetical protein
LFSQNRQDRLWRGELGRVVLNLRRTSRQELGWYAKFFSGSYDDRWYSSLFTGQEGSVTGEITPAYSVLEVEDIARIAKIMPEAKILYIIRNPIERGWSAVKTGIRHQIRKRRISRAEKKRQLREPFSPDKLERAFQRITHRQGYLLRSDYVRTIENWKRCFPEEQFFLGFFDDIVRDPKGLLSSVFAFLGVDSSEQHITLAAFQKINPSPSEDIPAVLERVLAEQHYPQIKTLSEMVGGHADRWLREVESILS